jgi:small ligand-binding sensory domain FIST
VAIAEGSTTPTPSEKACQWCPAKATCPAHVEQFNEVAAQPAMLTMTEDELAAMLAKVDVVEDYIKALRKYATERLESGSIIRGWQMQPKRAQRKWKDEKDAASFLLSHGVAQEKLYVTELISPAEAAKLLSKEDRALLDDITKKESSGLTLARAVGLGQ